MKIEVSIASKTPQSILSTPAAVFVITNEDLKRSGANSIPEALRMVPGFTVSRIDNNRYAITSRGFNGEFADSLLVMIDGRAVYSPLFSGVYWDEQDILLEDVERIEVVRGPGAAVWGANAVNGVVNIITKNANDTHGLLVSGGGGNEDLGALSARYGDKLGNDASYRVFTKVHKSDSSKRATGEDAYDSHESARAGFRMDWNESKSGQLTFQGDAYSAEEHSEFTTISLNAPLEKIVKQGNTDLSGGNLLVNWTDIFNENSNYSIRFYYDRTNRRDVVLDQIHNTYDLDFETHTQLNTFHALTSGLCFRLTNDNLEGLNNGYSFDPRYREDILFGAFIQDQIKLWKDQWQMIVGSKFENNDYTGFEIQPTLRFLYTPDNSSSAWISFSRAVHTPSRADEDIRIDVTALPASSQTADLPSLISIMGKNSIKSEELLAYEAGLRRQFGQNLLVDTALYYNSYKNLRNVNVGSSFPEFSPSPPHILVPLDFNSNDTAFVYGGEILIDWHPTSIWRLQANYAYMNFNLRAGSEAELPSTGVDADGGNPENQFAIRSLLNLSESIQLDSMLRFVDRLSDLKTDSYMELDIRLGWKLSKQVELSLIGRNLLDNQHAEYGGAGLTAPPTEIERSIFGRVTIALP